MATSTKPIPKIKQKSADQVNLVSNLNGPILDLSMLSRSLLFAEISMIAYMSPDQCQQAARRLGFTGGKFINNDGTQTYIFTNRWDCVVACRGTEPNEWNDIRADLFAVMVLAETVGRVHRGFKKEADDAWFHLEKELRSNQLPLWFTGHSLGGAIAQICAGRCFLSHIDTEPTEVYTFGSPRIGNRQYVNHINVPHFRWVHNNDIVTRVPPSWVGYRHHGTEMYINRNGQVKQIQGWRRFRDRLRGFAMGLARWRIDQFNDHLMDGYIESIDRAVKKNPAI